MSDVNAHIGIDFDTAGALAQLRRLQAGLSTFYQTLAEGNLAAANAQKGLNATLAQSIAANGKFAVSQKTVATSTLAFTTALEKNKLSMKEYFRYSAAAATANTKTLSRMFAQEREIINRARRDRVKSLQAQYVQMAKAQGGFVEAMRIMPRTLMMANGQFTELGTRIQYAAQRQQFLNQLLKQGSTNLLNFGKNMQWAGRQLMVGLTIPLTMLAGYASKAFRELEKETIKFKRVYGDAFTSQAETDAAVKNVQTIANEYMKFGVAVKDTMTMAADAAAAGFQGADLDKQIRSATKLAVLGQIEQQQALETTISLQNAFGLSADQLAEKINFLNAVENQTVLSIEDLTIAIPKAAPVVKQLGGNVEDLAFFLTAMKEGGINASEGANALKSGLASMINPTEKASKMLDGLGINIKGIIEANKGDLKGTVVGFARALDTLDPLNRARAIEQLFGKFQFARLSTLFQNVTKDGSQASRALDLAGKSVEELAILSEREMKKIEESTTFKFQAAMEQFKKDIMPLGKAFLEAVTPIVKFFSKVFEKFNSFSDGTKKTIAIITGVIAGIGPIALMTFGLMANGIANLVKLFATLRGGIAKLNGQNSILGGGFDYVTQQELENQAASQALHNTHTRLVEVFNVEKVAVSELAASYASLGSQMRTMASQNPGLFAGGVRGAKGAVKGLPPVRKYADGILSVPGPKGAGDVVPAMLSPQEAVIPSDRAQKYSGLITAIFNDKVPGFMAGRLPWGNNHPVKPVGPVDIKGPKPFAETQSQRVVAEQIADAVKASRYGSTKPTDFGALVQPFSGRSFPIPGVGGVYRKPNGKLVVVKPTMDEKTALAEVRATQIARDVHGLVSPKQTIRTMLDPTDPSGKRKLIVLESPYDPRIAETTGKFTQKDMITQLVASTLRADKDLQQANLSGNVLADVGTAGVFGRASGFRDYQTVLPGMGEMGLINLLGVKGGAKKFFAQETSALASNMTPQQYEAMIIKEIDKSLPKLRKLIDSWDLNPVERQVYENMYKRLEDGKKVDWKELHSHHVLAGKNVAKRIEGFDPSPNEKAMKEAISKYMLEGSQVDAVSSRLVTELDNEFNKELQKLKETNPQRAKAIQAAWTGVDSDTGRPAGKARQTKFHSVLKDMIPVNVNGETRYIHKKDFDDFASNPDQKIRNSRTRQEVLDQALYRMGLRPKGGRLVGDGDLRASKALNASAFAFDMQYTGKGSGGGRGNLSKTVKPIAAVQEAEYNARLGNVLNTEVGRLLQKAGYSDKDIRSYYLRPELSHLEGHGLGERQGAQSMKTGYAMYDARLINDFMRTQKRHNSILDWNDDQWAKVDSGKKGYPFIPKDEIADFRKAADFMSQGRHPVTEAERLLVAKAARLDELTLLAKQNGTPIRTGDLTKSNINHIRAIQAAASPGGIIPSRLMDLQALDSGKVLVEPGEIQVDKKTRKVSIVRGGASASSGTVRVGGSARDKVLGDERRNTYLPKPRAGVKLVPALFGRKTGTPGETTIKNPTVRQGEIAADLRRRGYSQAEIDKALRKLAKKELRIKQTQVGKADKAARVEAARLQEQERIQKESTEASRKNFLKQQHRERLNYAQATHYDAAVREDQKRTLKAQRQTQKEQIKNKRMMRQEKVGRWSGGASMALGTAGMGLMMAGQQDAGMAVMGASAVAGMAPMLTNPYVAAGTAVLAVAGSLWLLDKRAKQQAETTSKLVDATSATTEKMKAIGEMTNQVGASELMARRRTQQSSDRYVTGFERGKQQFGTTFLESDVGKNILQGFKDNIVQNGAEISAQQMAVQLAGYVSDGILSAEQAHSVAESIGLNLKNTTIGSQISGQLLDLIGPNGEDLLKNPLEVRVNLVNEQRDIKKQISSGFNKDVNSLNSAWLGSEKVMQKLPGFLAYSDQELLGTTKTEATASALAAYGAQNLEFNQAQIDSLNVQYEKQIAILEKEKAATSNKAKQAEIEDKIATLKSDQKSQTDSLRALNGELLKDQLASFKVAQQRGAVEDAFFDSLKSQVKTKWANDPMAEAFLKTSADLKSKNLEVTIDTIVASGQLSPMAATSLMTMFAGQEGDLQKTLETAIKFQDPGKFMEIVNFFGGMQDQKAGKKNLKLLVNMAQKNPDKADKLMSAIALMQKMDGKEVNLEAFFSGDDAQKKLEDLANSLQAVEDHKGPFTLKALTEVKELGGVNLEGILSRWSEFENLPDETKKTVIQEYVTLYKTIDESAVSDEIKRRVAEAPKEKQGWLNAYYNSTAGRDKVRQDLAGERTMQKVKQDIASKAAGAGSTDGTGSKKNPFADILTRLKNVRNAAINAAGGFDELKKAIAAAGDKSVANKFMGIEQQMMKKGYSKDFIDYMTGLDPTEQAKMGFTATKAGKQTYNQYNYKTGKNEKKTVKYKKGDFVLTDQGNAMRQAFDKAVVGEFEIAQRDVLKNINEQEVAYKTLKGLGLSNLEIEKAMENEAYVTAIATGQITKKELETNAALQKQALLREQIKSITDKTKTNETRIDALKKAPDLINFLSQLKTIDAEGNQVSLSITSIFDAIQDPEDLIKMVSIMEAIKNGTISAEQGYKDLFNFISTSEVAKDLEKNLLTPLERFQKAYDAAMKVFDAYKTMDEYTLKSNITGMDKNTGVSDYNGQTYKQLERTKTQSDEALAAMNAELAIYEHQISMIRSEIDQIEQSIENTDVSSLSLTVDGKKVSGKLKYVLEDLKEQISDWEREIEINPKWGDRAIKKLQDETNIYSHDLEVMDHQAQKINDKYDSQVKALEEVQKVNDSIIRQQEQQLNLADALTQGDIAAAAQAAQDMRAGNAEAFATSQTDALGQARDNAINALTNSQGMTKDQIEERRWEISQQIYAMENDPARLAIEEKIQQAKDAIYTIEDKRDELLLQIRTKEEAIYKLEQDKVVPLQKQIDIETTKNLALDYQLVVLGNIIAANDRNREIAGMTRDQWEEMLAQQTLMDEKLRKDIADALALFNKDSMTAEETWKRIKELYDAIKDKTVTITVNYVTGSTVTGPGDGNTGDGNTGDGNTGDGNTGDGNTGDGNTGTGNTGSGNKSGTGTSGTVSGVDAATPETPYKSTWQGISDPTARSHVKDMETNISANIAENSRLFAQKIAEKKATENAGSVAGMHLADLNRMGNSLALAQKYAGPESAKKQAEAIQKANADKAAKAKAAADLKKFGGNSIAASQFANWGHASGGLIKRFAFGGNVIGTDVVPAMLTPGEFIMSRYAVQKTGLDAMKAINNGDQVGDSVYNYSINVNVKSDANPDEIAKVVMTHIQRVNSQAIRSVRV